MMSLLTFTFLTNLHGEENEKERWERFYNMF